jgi:hypothetical protein
MTIGFNWHQFTGHTTNSMEPFTFKSMEDVNNTTCRIPEIIQAMSPQQSIDYLHALQIKAAESKNACIARGDSIQETFFRKVEVVAIMAQKRFLPVNILEKVAGFDANLTLPILGLAPFYRLALFDPDVADKYVACVKESFPQLYVQLNPEERALPTTSVDTALRIADNLQERIKVLNEKADGEQKECEEKFLWHEMQQNTLQRIKESIDLQRQEESDLRNIVNDLPDNQPKKRSFLMKIETKATQTQELVLQMQTEEMQLKQFLSMNQLLFENAVKLRFVGFENKSYFLGSAKKLLEHLAKNQPHNSPAFDL